MLLIGVGVGTSFPALMTLAMSGATPEDAGLASGLVNTSMQVGGAIGLAVLATLATERTEQRCSTAAPRTPRRSTPATTSPTWSAPGWRRSRLRSRSSCCATSRRPAKGDAARGPPETEREPAGRARPTPRSASRFKKRERVAARAQLAPRRRR